MNIIGLDFGSHASSIALWTEDKGSVEVIADDLGSRTIPSFVGFRTGEVIVGQAAMSQFHKNSANTFEDVRSLILNPDVETVYVPALEKDLPVQEIVSHYFRNIHNQIKQQVGKAVRDCVISLPEPLNETMQKRLYEAAQAGGIRIKSMILDSAATLLSYGFDDSNVSYAKVLVVDIGWSKSEVSYYVTSGGLLFPKATQTTDKMSGKVLVDLLADHCAKDFMRKTKTPCHDNKKSMLRLRRECEESMKHLSTGQESTIDIDSLCEGIDYSTKISRARFEDMSSIPLVNLKNTINDVLSKSNVTADSVTHICLTGGLSAVPKYIATIKAIFNNAHVSRGKFESNETQCIGASLHGKYLYQLGLLDTAPTTTAKSISLSAPISLQYGANTTDAALMFPQGTVIPSSTQIDASLTNHQGYFKILGNTPATVLGEVVVSAEEEDSVKIHVSLNADASITIEVKNNSGDKEYTTLTIPKA